MINEYVIQSESVIRDTEYQKEDVEDLSGWSNVFALDVPDIYLEDGYDSDGVPKKLPKSFFLRKCYKDAKSKGLGFNVYALARTLKSERGPIVGGFGGEKWKQYSDQYKAIGSMVLCRMLGYGLSQEFNEDSMFGKNLYTQTTGLVKIAVAHKYDWGPFGTASNGRKGAAFATSKDLSPDNLDDMAIVQAATNILNGQWFIGDNICGAISFNHPSNLKYYNNIDSSAVKKTVKILEKQSPIGKSEPNQAMGGQEACWVQTDGVGLKPTQILLYARMPLKTKPKLRNPPKEIPWANNNTKRVPRLSDPPAFEYAKAKGMLRDEYCTKYQTGQTNIVESEKTQTELKNYEEFKRFKDAKNVPIPSEHGFFVMDGHLLEAMRKLSSVDLAMISPIISLFYFDKQNNNKVYLNVHMIRNANYEQDLLETDGRPPVGLLSVDIISRETSSAFITDEFNIKFKVFDRKVFDPGGILFPFFFPEFPFGIEYGVHYSGESQDPVVQKLVNWTKVQICNPVSYSVSIDEKGIIEFAIRAVSGVNHAFNKFSVGSFALKDSDIITTDYAEAWKNLKAIQDTIADLEEQKVKAGVGEKQAKKLSQIIKKNKTQHEKCSKKTQTILGEIFAKKMEKLYQAAVPNPNYKPTKGKTKKHNQWVSIGTVIRELCIDDLEAAMKMYAATNNTAYALVWGKFNSSCGDYANKIIDEFLVPIEDLKTKIRDVADIMQGASIRLDAIMNILMGYLNEESVYRMSGKEYDKFARADILYYVKQDIAKDGKEYVECIIVDRKRGIDYTSDVSQLFDEYNEDLEFRESNIQKINKLKQHNVAYIQMAEGHAFAKSIKLNTEMDENIIKISFEKMYRNKSFVADLEREAVATDVQSPQAHTDKLTLPLKANIEVLGHPMWEALKTMYLLLPSNEWSGFYHILNITHSIGLGMPKTTLELMYQKYNR